MEEIKLSLVPQEDFTSTKSSSVVSIERHRAFGATRPFLKWAGGKSQLLPLLRRFIPQRFNRYFEPFLGGGALYFDLSPEEAYLSDSNSELINCYQVVRDYPDRLIKALSAYKISREEFYRVRALNPHLLSDVQQAARVIYLNKTCYNGLYRVNKRGQFNTPFGNCKNLRLIDPDNLLRVSVLLKSAKILCSDYVEVVLSEARRGDLVYFDPPYLSLGGYSDFKRYTKEFFYERNHEELARVFRTLHARGCYLLLSNSYRPEIMRLYDGFQIHAVSAPRAINCRADRRGLVRELIVINFFGANG